MPLIAQRDHICKIKAVLSVIVTKPSLEYFLLQMVALE